MNAFQFQIVIAEIGLRPPYREVVEHIYGVGANVDTEGDSNPSSRTDWTWLSMGLRPSSDLPDIEVLMPAGQTGCMVVQSNDEQLAIRTASFLANRTGGRIVS